MLYKLGFRTLAVVGLVAGALIAVGCGSKSGTNTVVFNMVSATAEFGQADFSHQQPNQGGDAGTNTVSSPTGSVDGDQTTGLFYIADTFNNRVLGFTSIPTTSNPSANFILGQASSTGTALNGGGTGPTATSLAFPTKISISGGMLAVTDSGNNRVLIWTTLPAGPGVPATIVVGQTDFVSSAPGTTASTLNNPTAAIIADGKLVVADQLNNRVLIWNTVPTVNGQPADTVVGQTDFTSNISNQTACTQSTLLTPSDVWTDGVHIFIADTGYDRVMYYAQFPHSNGADASFVLGQASFTFFNGESGQAFLNAPAGVGSDGSRVFVADTANNRVLIFDSFPIQNGGNAYAVLGQENFHHNQYNLDDSADTVKNQCGAANSNPQDCANYTGRTPTARTLFQPSAVSAVINDNKNIYVTDRSNNRIMVFNTEEVPP